VLTYDWTKNGGQVISMQADLAFPQSLAEKYRPVRVADFIGLDRPKKVLSAFCKRPASGAWLFVGPSGLGKSAMALALASELEAELHKIPSQKCNAQSIEETVRRCWFASMTPGGFHVVLADEADQMTNAAQLALLSKLDSTKPAPNTIWIFTANDTERLERRFLSRCKVLEFLAMAYPGRLPVTWRRSGIRRVETETDRT
jgi:replication-associated recombination protein RarA